MKLTQQDMDDHKRASEKFYQITGKFNERIEEVSCLIHKTLGAKHRNYWYSNAQEGELGSLSDSDLYNKDNYIWLVYESAATKLTFDHIDYSSEVPTAFLYMDDEEIIKELKKDIELDKQKKAKKLSLRKISSEKRKALAKSALSKLNVAERKALGLTVKK